MRYHESWPLNPLTITSTHMPLGKANQMVRSKAKRQENVLHPPLHFEEWESVMKPPPQVNLAFVPFFLSSTQIVPSPTVASMPILVSSVLHSSQMIWNTFVDLSQYRIPQNYFILIGSSTYNKLRINSFLSFCVPIQSPDFNHVKVSWLTWVDMLRH